MKINKKICAAILSASMTISLLTGCSSADKNAIKETSENFLSVVVSGTTDNIEKYANDSVSNGQFVRTFDSAYLAQKFKDGFKSDEVDAETSAKVDSFCELFSSMVTGYEIKDVTVDKNGIGTVTATIDTAFPINVIDNEEAVSKMNTITENYVTENADEIQSLYENHTDEEVESIVYNDMIVEILDMYEGLIQNASPETYAIVLTVEKNTETDSWVVTNVSTYDSASTGTTETAAETATAEASQSK
ncbi:MAG: hypothetical protein K5792_11340 [Butyrivibrio sp.]|nr:hypothetical protein [Butyrivibrio sp.]